MARTRRVGDFPFLINRGVLDGPGFPLETVLRWYWGVRLWYLTVSLQGTLSGTTTEPGPEIGTTREGYAVSLAVGASERYTVGRYGVTDENDLDDAPPTDVSQYYDASGFVLSGAATATGENEHGPLYNPATLALVGGNFSLFTYYSEQGTPHAPVVFDPESGLYRPSLSIGVELGAIAVGAQGRSNGLQLLAGTAGSSLFGTGSWTDRIVAIDIPVTIDGKSYGTVRGGYRYEAYNPAVLDISDVSFTINITPLAFWPQAGRDGIALFNSATGLPATKPGTTRPFTYEEIVAMPVP